MLTEQTTEPPLDHLDARGGRAEVVAAIEARPRRSTSRRASTATSSRSCGTPATTAPGARREPSRGHRAAAPREGARRRRATRLRRAGGHTCDGPVGAPPPSAAGAGGALGRRQRGETSCATRSTGHPYRCETGAPAPRDSGWRRCSDRGCSARRRSPPSASASSLAGARRARWARAAPRLARLERRLCAGERVEGDDLEIESAALHRRRLLGGSRRRTRAVGALGTRSRARGRGVVVFPRCRAAGTARAARRRARRPARPRAGRAAARRRLRVLVRPRVRSSTRCSPTTARVTTGAARSLLRRRPGSTCTAFATTRRASRCASCTGRRRPAAGADGDGAPGRAARGDRRRARLRSRRRRRPSGRSSFDEAVACRGALVRATSCGAGGSSLVGTAPAAGPCAMRSRARLGGALDLLAAVEPVAGARIDRALRSPARGVARARELVVVTCRPEAPSSRCSSSAGAAAGRRSSIVAAETYAGAPRDRAAAGRCCGSPARAFRWRSSARRRPRAALRRRRGMRAVRSRSRGRAGSSPARSPGAPSRSPGRRSRSMRALAAFAGVAALARSVAMPARLVVRIAVPSRSPSPSRPAAGRRRLGACATSSTEGLRDF